MTGDRETGGRVESGLSPDRHDSAALAASEEVEIRGKPGGRGGARPGAGRKRLTLAELIAERRFVATSQRHCKLLELEDAPAARPDLVEIQRGYRRATNRGDRAHLARVFAERVGGSRS